MSLLVASRARRAYEPDLALQIQHAEFLFWLKGLLKGGKYFWLCVWVAVMDWSGQIKCKESHLKAYILSCHIL